MNIVQEKSFEWVFGIMYRHKLPTKNQVQAKLAQIASDQSQDIQNGFKMSITRNRSKNPGSVVNRNHISSIHMKEK